jgi:hypothetical protein
MAESVWLMNLKIKAYIGHSDLLNSYTPLLAAIRRLKNLAKPTGLPIIMFP